MDEFKAVCAKVFESLHSIFTSSSISMSDITKMEKTILAFEGQANFIQEMSLV